MKIRMGFVSNSSSSSFLIGLPERPKNKKHLSSILIDRVGYDEEFEFEFRIGIGYDKEPEYEPYSIKTIADYVADRAYDQIYSKDGKIDLDSLNHWYMSLLFEDGNVEKIYSSVFYRHLGCSAADEGCCDCPHNISEVSKMEDDNIADFIPIIKDLFKDYYVVEAQFGDNGSSLDYDLENGLLTLFIKEAFLPMLIISNH